MHFLLSRDYAAKGIINYRHPTQPKRIIEFKLSEPSCTITFIPNVNHLLNSKDVGITLRPLQPICDSPLPGVYTLTILYLNSFDICRGFLGIPKALTTLNTP
jgi:hypothetical protein